MDPPLFRYLVRKKLDLGGISSMLDVGGMHTGKAIGRGHVREMQVAPEPFPTSSQRRRRVGDGSVL